MATGENNQAFLKITDMTRALSLALLALHLYYYGYAYFASQRLTWGILDELLLRCSQTGLFNHAWYSKGWALLLLSISLLAIKGRKEPGFTPLKTGLLLVMGLILYWASAFIFYSKLSPPRQWEGYMILTLTGFMVYLMAGTYLSRIIQKRFRWDNPFNDENETFPQQSRKMTNAYSINLPAAYSYKGRKRSSWINIINPFRGLLVLGTPGAGKSYFVIRHIITQHLNKGFTMFVYDFKYDDLTRIAYNTYLDTLQSRGGFLAAQERIRPSFYVINFDDLSRSHRCNPLQGIIDKDQAVEAAKTILLGLNREWIKRQGDFFVESAVNFLAAIIFFLARYQGGKYCSLPHAIELLQTDYDRLLSILRVETENEALINAFVNAYLHGAMEQLEGQMASPKIALGRISSARLYYVLSGQDFQLDVNNPQEPKIVCLGSNPQKSQVYGAVLSLYANRLFKDINQPNKLPCSLIFDEFPTLYLRGMDQLMATSRSNKVATTLGLQDLTQLRKEYGREEADVMMNLAGNIISGQVTGDTAKYLSERIGKILQLRPSYSINSSDTSHSYARQLELALPVSRISTLSSGEFVGYVADDPQQRIVLKAFHAEIKNNHQAIAKQQNNYQPLPLIREVTHEMVEKNYELIRQQARQIIDITLDRMYRDPALSHLIVCKYKPDD